MTNDKECPKIVAINRVNYGSTGKIMLSIQAEAKKAGFWYRCACSNTADNKRNGFSDCLFIGNRISRKISQFFKTYFGLFDLFNLRATRRFLKQLKLISPSIVHLHNLHDNYINIKMLFRFLARQNISVVWTFHDCWPITGRCPYFSMTGCDKWKTGCCQCAYPKTLYPTTRVDATRKMWRIKRKAFSGPRNMTIVTPSNWLAGLVRESYLGQRSIRVINNGIDLSSFYPRNSSFRARYGLENEFLVLGVSFVWEPRKGLDVFIKLASVLPPQFRIILVGTDATIDSLLPKGVISIHRTNSQDELAELYSTADLFLNPTREDNFPTVNIEALACGTPVFTFAGTGSPEIIDDTCGLTFSEGDFCGLVAAIQRVAAEKPFSPEACVARAKVFDREVCFAQYVNLYREIMASAND